MEVYLIEYLEGWNRIYKGGMNMFRKLFDGRRKFVTLAVLAAMLVAAVGLGLSSVAYLKNGKTTVNVVPTGSAVPLFTENSLPPAAIFEQLAPFDVVLDTRGWKIVLMTAALLDTPVPGGYIWDIEEGFAIVRVERDGQIYVRDTKFTLSGAIPIADDKGDLSFVRTKLTVLGVDNQPLTFRTKEGVRTAPQVGKIDTDGFFNLPWIVRVESDQFPQPFTLYFETWGFLGKDVISAGRSYGDFGTLYGLKNVPAAVQRGLEVMARRRAEVLGEPFVEVLTNFYNFNFLGTRAEVAAFAKKFLANLHKVPQEVRADLERAFLFVHALLIGG